MNWKLLLTLLAVLTLGGVGAYLVINNAPAEATSSRDDSHGHEGHDEHAAAGVEKGPHGGRLLREGNFSVELAIFAQGGPPEFRAWFTAAGKPADPGTVKLNVEVKRPDHAVERFTFQTEDDYARSSTEVAEPHSFDYSVTAEHAGISHRWEFSAPEMQSTISGEAAKRAGIVTEVAGAATIVDSLAVYGQVKLNANKIARAVPRFAGIVHEARKSIGDKVAAGEVVAIVETNQSLVSIEVKAPIGGVIVDRDVNAGETVTEAATLYTIADLSEVWIDLGVPKHDHARVKIGQSVKIFAEDGGAPATAKIEWISPTGSAEAQTLTARVVLPNPDQRWRPGLFVKAEVTIAETSVPVAVKASAIQTLFDFTVVFSQHGEIYQARPLQLGRRSGGYVEVLKGLKAGERYVSENSFLLKADIGKSGASHDH